MHNLPVFSHTNHRIPFSKPKKDVIGSMTGDDRRIVLARIRAILDQLAATEGITPQELRASICHALSYAEMSALPDRCSDNAQKDRTPAAEEVLLRLICTLL